MKIAIYTRVSTHWQIDKDSLQVQKRELVAYSEMILGCSDIEIFEDPGYSAKNTDRPAFQQMLSRLRAGEFTHLLVWKIDRISRNIIDFANFYNELKKLGVVFVSKNEQFDTSSAIGEAMLKIILVFAELERNMTAERVSQVMSSRAQNGQWNGGRVPYGYSYENGEFSINQPEYEIYKRMVSEYENTGSILKVTNSLNDSGIRTRFGNLWSTTTVHKILSNQFYTGDYVYNVHDDGKGTSKRPESEWITVEEHHIPLIDKPRFDNIQYLLKHNRRNIRKPKDTFVRKHIHLFAGMVICGECGANMIAIIDRTHADGWNPTKYLCGDRRRGQNCSNKMISDKTLIPFVFKFIENLLKLQSKVTPRTRLKSAAEKLAESLDCTIPEEDVKAILSAICARDESEYHPIFEKVDEGNDEEQLLKEQYRKNDVALNRLRTLFLYGDESLTNEDYVAERTQIIDAQAKIEQRLAELKTKEIRSEHIEKTKSYMLMSNLLTTGNNVDYIRVIRAMDKTVAKDFLNAVIDTIIAKDGKIIEIKFKSGIRCHFVRSGQ